MTKKFVCGGCHSKKLHAKSRGASTTLPHVPQEQVPCRAGAPGATRSCTSATRRPGRHAGGYPCAALSPQRRPRPDARVMREVGEPALSAHNSRRDGRGDSAHRPSSSCVGRDARRHIDARVLRRLQEPRAVRRRSIARRRTPTSTASSATASRGPSSSSPRSSRRCSSPSTSSPRRLREADPRRVLNPSCRRCHTNDTLFTPGSKHGIRVQHEHLVEAGFLCIRCHSTVGHTTPCPRAHGPIRSMDQCLHLPQQPLPRRATGRSRPPNATSATPSADYAREPASHDESTWIAHTHGADRHASDLQRVSHRAATPAPSATTAS